jgi:hypothetical protein
MNCGGRAAFRFRSTNRIHRNTVKIIKFNSSNIKIGVPLVLVGVAIIFGIIFRNFILLQYDAVRLAIFAHRIADTDRMVAIYPSTPVKLVLAGRDAQMVVHAIRSAGSGRMPNAEIDALYDVDVIFYKDTNHLGEIRLQNNFFVLDPRQPPFGCGILATRIYQPVIQSLKQYWQTNGAAK